MLSMPKPVHPSNRHYRVSSHFQEADSVEAVPQSAEAPSFATSSYHNVKEEAVDVPLRGEVPDVPLSVDAKEATSPSISVTIDDIFSLPHGIVKAADGRGHAATAIKMKETQDKRRLRDMSFRDWTVLHEEYVLLKGFDYRPLLRRFASIDVNTLKEAFASGLPLQLTIALFHYFHANRMLSKLSTGSLLVLLEPSE